MQCAFSYAVGKFIQDFEREMDVCLAADGGTIKQILSAQVRSVLDWVGNQDELRFFQTGTNHNDLWMCNLIDK